MRIIFQSLFILLAIGLIIIATLWLSGVMFFMVNKTWPDISNIQINTWLTYYSYYSDNPIIAKKLKISFVISLAICVLIPFVLVLLTMKTKKRSLFGDAKFASLKEVKKSGLYKNDSKFSIIIGFFQGGYLAFDGQQFILVSAPTRSWKGVALVIPNLLHYSGSIICLDIKQENYNITSKYRELHGQQVFLFNPFAEDLRSCRYNPLSYVRDDDFRVSDLMSIGEIFYPSGGKDAFFDDQARNLFVGLGLYLCETPSLPRTIGELLRQSTGKGQPINEYLEGIILSRNYLVDDEGNATAIEWDGIGDKPLSYECVNSLRQFINTSDNTRSSILASFNAPLGIWTNPVVDAATSCNDFDLRDVRKKLISVYIGITPDHLPEAGRIINLFFSQLITLNTKELPQDNPELIHPCLLLLDEFTAAGCIKIIGKAVSYIAGYNIRLMTIIQSPSQLEGDFPDGYGKAGSKTLMTNHACRILFAPKEQDDAEAYSKMLGNETVKSRSVNLQAKSKGSESDHSRALLLPQEIKDIGLKKEIIILENFKPILCDKIQYYADPVFIDRLKEASPSLAALKKKIPTRPQLENAIQKMELAAHAPKLDIATHRAKIESRLREVTPEDVENSIDLNKIKLDLSQINFPEDDKIELSTEDVSSFVDSFFNAFGNEQEPQEQEQIIPNTISAVTLPSPVLPESNTTKDDLNLSEHMDIFLESLQNTNNQPDLDEPNNDVDIENMIEDSIQPDFDDEIQIDSLYLEEGKIPVVTQPTPILDLSFLNQIDEEDR